MEASTAYTARELMNRFISSDTKHLLHFLAAYRGRYMLGCLFMTCTDMGQLAVPWLVGQVVDRLSSRNIDAAGVRHYALALVITAVFVAVTRYGWRAYIFGTARLVDRDLRQRLYQHLQALSLDFHLRHKVGDLMAHATNDVQAVRAMAGEGVMAGWDTLVMGFGAAAMVISTVDWRLGAVALSPLLLIGPCGYWIANKLHHSYEGVQAAFSLVSDRAQEGFAGIRVVKGFARERHQEIVFAEANTAYQAAFAHMCRYDVAFDPVMNLLASMGFAIGLFYGGWLVLTGRLSVGQFVAFNSFLGMLTWPMLALGWTINLLQRSTASMGRLQKIFDAQPVVRDAADAQPLRDPQGHLELRGLSFAYSSELAPALSGVSLVARPGATIGIMGGTGAGKSTLANLLVRLFNPPRGQVLLDGIDVNDIKLADLRAAVAYVPQDGFLFSRSIAENVAFDPKPHDDESMRTATRRAQLESDVLEFPHGYETMLGERGVTLSGGQRQRLGIARALLKDAPILVLDDCLSAVDSDTETRLLAELKSDMATRTTLVISHRTSALAHCDEILVISNGCVTERGRHEQLVALGGEYARVNKRQQLEAAIDGMS
jgi:ATP-binding cassette subfamily B multidrug efflux pump